MDEELTIILNRAASVRQRLLSFGQKASSALDTCSLEDEDDFALCSDIETFPDLLQLRINQLVELCMTDPKTFAKPQNGVSSKEQYQAYVQSIVRELRRNLNAAESVADKAEAGLDEILSKVHPVSLTPTLSRLYQQLDTEAVAEARFPGEEPSCPDPTEWELLSIEDCSDDRQHSGGMRR